MVLRLQALRLRRRAPPEGSTRDGEEAQARHAVSPVTIDGRTIARTFWGKAWCENLESYSDFANRLPRGRTYVRNGSVVHLEIQPGKITALVSGSELYTVEITITALPDSHWKSVKSQCSGQIGSLVELLQGRLSKSVMDVVTQHDEGLFPKPAEIQMKCSCPDWAGMCKHIAAVMYGIGARLDEKPELLFLLRKVDHLELIAGAVDGAPVAKPGKPRGKKTIAASDLADVFGIEMAEAETPSDALPATAKEPAKPRVPATKKVSKKAPKRAVTTAKKASAAPAAQTEQAQNGQGPPAACKPSTRQAFLAQAGEARGIVTALDSLAQIRAGEARAEPESLMARQWPCPPGITKIQVDSISSTPEELRNPGRLIGAQSRYDLGFTVIDFTSVRPCIIAAVEHSLEIERDRRITGQKGDLNRRQWFLEVHWVDVIRFDVVEGMDRDVIVE